MDIPMPEGTPVLAARAGTVIETESRRGSGAEDDPLTDNGNYVRVRHADGTMAIYAHLMFGGVAVKPGESVEAGRLLGHSGTTGFSTGPHLHFGISRMDRPGRTGAGAVGGLAQEVSIPFRFYVGEPPQPFAPRAALVVTADYSANAMLPRPLGDPRRFPEPRVHTAEEVELAWWLLAAAIASVAGGTWWFWRFSRS